MAEALGVSEAVTSPTFVLEKIYELPAGGPFSRLIHLDAYRLEGDTSLVPLSFADFYADPANLIVLEWPELVASQLPKPEHAITLSVADNNAGEGRTISYA